jgi:hypothetical protein
MIFRKTKSASFQAGYGKPPGTRFRKIRNGSRKAISLFDAKDSLFTAEQGILCNPLDVAS